MEDERLVPALLSQLQSGEEEVRLAVVSALGTIGGDEARVALTELLESRDRDMRTAAKDALDELLNNDNLLDGM